MMNVFWLSALKRAGWTAAQTALGMITLGVGIQEVDWISILSVSALAAVYSLLKSVVVGMPEVSDGDAGT